MNSFMEFIFNIMAIAGFFYYVGFRIKKIHDDYHDHGSFSISYYVPTAIACILVFTYGVAFKLWPIIITTSVEFVVSFVGLIYYSYKKRQSFGV